VGIRGRLTVLVSALLVAQIPAQATAADVSPATDMVTQPSASVCHVPAPSDPPLWELSLPTAQVSTSMSTSDPGCVKQVGATANGVTWRNPDGLMTSRLYSTPVNYQAANGSWQPIDTRLVSDGTGGIVNKAGPFDVHFASDASASSLVSVGQGDASLSFGFDGALGADGGAATHPSSVAGSVGGDAQDTMTYAGALPQCGSEL
jgi:hypothetical protein